MCCRWPSAHLRAERAYLALPGPAAPRGHAHGFRGWMEAAEFLVGFVDACGESLDAQELRDWERLMACDDMFLMRLVAERTAAPPELDTPLLQKLRGHFASAGPSPGLVVE
mmetsp:Transcript_14338/g.50307  ORF Transcript_14338/g.50307 Transcript_14338/m.50307 type:complete len:111 (-) Transcript_14338:790-1122(-)